MLRDRFTLLYRFLLDPDTNTWVDLTPQVDSRQTSITQNLCTTAFKSAKDEASFVMPETPLFEADGVTPTPKKKLIDKIMSGDDILVQINAPGDVDIQWNGEDVLWNGEHVQWRGSVRYFTGYVDRSSITLRSYPLPPKLDIKLQDVSVLHLDDKVDYHILLENKKISEIVTALLGYAGYTDIGSLSLDVADDETLEAFVIDKDSAKTYRQYIDDLLFEAGGYVLDFNEFGQANVVHLKWDGSVAASRNIDNPMNSEGVSMKSAYLKEDGVSVKWASLAWTGPDKIIYNADIQQGVDENGNLTGVKVPMNTFWPDGGETAPNYFQYQEERLDLPYFQNATKFKNEDVSMIMAKDIWVDMDSMRNKRPYSGWTYVNPVVWPAGNNWYDKYGIPTNPCLWPKKAFYLLYNPQWPVVTPNGTENPKGEGWFTESGGVYTKTNDTTVQPGTTYYLGATYTAVVSPDPLAIPVAEHWYEESGGIYTISDDLTVDPNKTYYKATGGDADLLFFTIHGNVLYKYKINVVDMAGSKNPKTYESTYIYNQAHAERFAQFWWHFLQTSRYQFSWSEPNVHSSLNDVVAVGVKGNNSMQKALIAGKTSRWINDNVEVISYTAVGIDTYTPASLVPISVVPSSTKTQVQPVSNAIVADLHTAAVKTLAEWQDYVGLLSTWGVDNVSDFTVGDTAIINGTISDMDNLPITLYISVSEVDSVGQTISGTGIKIEYVPIVKTWDFEMSQNSATTDRRLSYGSTEPYTFTKIRLTAIKTGNDSILPKWSCTGTKAFFNNPGTQTDSGDTADLIIPKDETNSLVQVTMTDYYNPGTPTITKGIAIVDQTEYNHDFGAWTPTDDGTNVYILPDHITKGAQVYDVLDGDFFISKGFSTSGTAIVSPSGNPHENGYYERGGAGTLQRPYYYFLSADTSVDGGKTYYTPAGTDYPEGVPYILESGPSWNEMTVSQDNASRLLQCMGNVMNSGIAVPSETAIWGWFQNLVAQNGIIQNLFTHNITVLDDGCIHSDYYNDDGTLNLAASISTDSATGVVTLHEEEWFSAVGNIAGTFEWWVEVQHGGVRYFHAETGNPLQGGYYNDLEQYGIYVDNDRDFNDDDYITVTVVSAIGSSVGFWLGADGTMKCTNGYFNGQFDCDVIKTEVVSATVTGTYSAASSTSQAKNLINAFPTGVKPEYPANIPGAADTWSDYLTVQMTTPKGTSSNIAYVRLHRKRTSNILFDLVHFYDSARNELDAKDYFTITGNATAQKYLMTRTANGTVDYYLYATTTVTIETTQGGNRLTVNIPNDPSGLSSGQLFKGSATTILGVTCYPVYVVG